MGEGRYNLSYMDPLARLFGSTARLKVLRLFLFNDDQAFPAADVAFRTKTSKDLTRKELSTLVASGLVKKKMVGGKPAYQANKKWQHYDAIQQFVRSTTELNDGEMVETLKRAGNLRLVVLSGLFTGAVDTKVDLFVVGDKLEDKHLESAVHTLEAELGRELCYAAFTTEDFRYRQGVYDRLIRDIFDYPHRTVLDKIGLK